MRALYIGILSCVTAASVGCRHPEITAVSLNPCEQDVEGIPFYLPKPLLIVSKNFRNIEEPKVGLTDGAPIPHGFDDQAKYADVNARTNFTAGTTTPSPASPASSGAAVSGPRLHSAGAPVTPGKVDSDGMAPQTFFTYQIVFVPDLTQKYGLKVRGGAGEIRAAMNLVNGWQYTGMGPFYMKDSSSAQNILSSGITANLAASGVADVVSSVADLTGELQAGDGTVTATSPQVKKVVKKIEGLDAKIRPIHLPNYAEIHVFEPNVTPDGMMTWTEIVALNFDRTILAKERTDADFAPPEPNKKTSNSDAGLQSGTVRGDMARAVVARTLGIPLESAALRPARGELQSGETPVTTPAGQVTQVHVDCGNCGKSHCRRCREQDHSRARHSLFGHRRRPRIERRAVFGFGALTGGTATPSKKEKPKAANLGGLQSGETDAGTATVLQQPILNQPVLNQPRFNDKASPQKKR